MVSGARIRGQRICIVLGLESKVNGLAFVLYRLLHVKWSQSCLMHFTLVCFYVRSKGKCS